MITDTSNNIAPDTGLLGHPGRVIIAPVDGAFYLEVKMSKGQIPWNKGKNGVYSPSALDKMRIASTGRPAWNKGISANISEKVCTRCSKLKKIDEFYRMKKDSPQRVPHCKDCQKIMGDKYRVPESGREKIREQFRDRYKRKTREYIEKATQRAIKKPCEVSASGAARYALKRGIITKSNCEKCGSEKVEMHHKDYSKPLEVTFLCRSCHMKEHNNLK